MSKLNRYGLGVSALVVAFASVVGSAMAAGDPYDISPVTTGIGTELAANVPVVLAAIAGLIALSVSLRFLVKHFRG